LFAEIDKAYEGQPSLFDEVGACDLVLAFFPCVRFECQSQMMLNGNKNGMEKWDDIHKLEYAMKTHEELHRLYMLLCKLFVIANRGGWKMIVENPANQPHYLTGYFPIKPKLIDKDRRANGDFYKKPTQYWFVNCDPMQNMFLESLEQTETMNIEHQRSKNGKNVVVLRSLMHPQYARRFIKSFVLDGE